MEAKAEAMVGDVVYWSFLHFFHTDKANAQMHLAPVRFSPITFRLASAMDLLGFVAEDTPELSEVLFHVGKYELDHGR